MSIFTPEDLLLYLYKETSPEQNAAIEAALTQDWELREQLAILQDSTKELQLPLETPRMEVVLNVLNYAREAVETGA
ncbi:hypothetical protein [Flavihumibacter solisilvae]|jgi:hypothetical protein|uniref:Uncharacterized protein n=1 Tax=Flavihumibacter solisilvae TaxID=1349421 RepID=A0A0C1IKN2_9BACT|nr:hypothetical protein [Flavihumibacter solisilvae]KIC94745.1 hypothetical protein OI18_09710 [Flavihumibacter solisilvae]